MSQFEAENAYQNSESYTHQPGKHENKNEHMKYYL